MNQAKEIPTQFGRYRILKELGKGGMGVVHLAEDGHLGRRVAIKVPFFDGFDSKEGRAIIERFEREARAAAAIQHPHICPIFDIGEHLGFHYLTMPYIEGQTLAQLVGPERPLPPREAATLVQKLARALAFMHQRDIIHRDLKPGNIMIKPDGEPVIMDFGLARFLTSAITITHPDALIGTPAYMSPQQCRTEKHIGPETDVYSLGVIFYQLITGEIPFDGPVHAVIGQKLHGKIDPPSSVRGKSVAPLDGIVLKAMAREVRDRYRSMEEFAQGLDNYLTGVIEVAPVLPTVTCPNCSKVLKIPPEKRGKKIKCPFCQTPLAAPGGKGPETENNSSHQTVPPVRKNGAGQAAGRDWSLMLVGLFLLLSLVLIYALMQMGGGETKGKKTAPDRPPEKKVAFSNTFGMKFVPVPAGTFWMSHLGVNAQRQATIPRDFYLGAYEVTQQQWEDIRGSNPSWHSRNGGLKASVYAITDADLKQFPVEGVSGHDVQVFLRALNEREREGNWLYRLPTEEEWEYACRGAVSSSKECSFDFYFERPTNSLFTALANFAGLQPDGSRLKDSYLQRPTTVGSYDPNQLGLYDMHGNVWEWCLSSSATDSGQVIRGGGWSSRAEGCRTASREITFSTDQKGYLGFRVARVSW